MTDSEIIYLAEAAEMLGRGETALRGMIQRAQLAGRKANLPPYFKVGGKWAFHRSAVKSWVKKQGKAGA